MSRSTKSKPAKSSKPTKSKTVTIDRTDLARLLVTSHTVIHQLEEIASQVLQSVSLDYYGVTGDLKQKYDLDS